MGVHMTLLHQLLASIGLHVPMAAQLLQQQRQDSDALRPRFNEKLEVNSGYCWLLQHA